MEGPYRDLGGGFARLVGAEGARRSPGRIRSVEDALFELLRNSRDAGAQNVYVASSLRARRYRTLVVIDDGRGLPETHKHLIFEPGVTTRHLEPVLEPDQNNTHPGSALHGAGLSLYHIKNVALLAEVFSTSAPTAIKAVFDTYTLPEKSLQTSNIRPSMSNLPATLGRFVTTYAPQAPHLYHASPARILARILDHRIIQIEGDRGAAGRLWKVGRGLGLEVSLRTVQRVIAGEVPVADMVVVAGVGEGKGRTNAVQRNRSGGPILSVGADDLAEIRDVLRRVAKSSYLDLAGLDLEKRPGEVIVRARIYEPEDQYE